MSHDSGSAESPLPGEKPTGVRHLVVGVSMLMAILLYLDRFCVGMAEPYIKQDLGLSTFQVSLFFSAFFLPYALGQVPSGWLSDRYGARLMLALYILAWSFFTGMMGLSYGFAMLILMRAAYGLGQAGAYPTSASILSKWVPFRNRGTASSIVAFGGRLGGAIAPVLTAFLIVAFVPIEKSSLLESTSLLNAPTLALKVARSNGSPSAAAHLHVRSLLSESVREEVDEVSYDVVQAEANLLAEAAKLKERGEKEAAEKKVAQAGKLEFEVSAGLSEQLVDSLNRIIQGNALYTSEAFDQMKSLDKAALAFLRRVNNDETLSTAERERFHRLLLESTFPEELRKQYVDGWRPVMVIYGLLGLFVAGLFWVVLRNRPADHPWCNEAEVQLIDSGRPPGAPSPHGKAGNVPWVPILRSRSMWLNCFGQVGTNIGWVFLVTWFPRYLLEQHQVPILQRGLMASTPLFIGWLGMLGGGQLTDFLVARVGLRWGRRIPWSFSRFIGMTAFLCCPLLDSPWQVTIALAVVAVSTDLGTSSSWAFCQDVGGRYVGSILGWGNMWGNLGATVSPILLAWVFETFGWTPMFYVCAGAFFCAGMFAMGIDATIPIAPPDEELTPPGEEKAPLKDDEGE